MAEELLEQIPPEKRWAITAQILARFIFLRGDKLIAPQLGVGKDIISPLWSKEKWFEIQEKVLPESATGMMQTKKMFNIPVDDAIGAAKLVIVGATLLYGPEQKWWEIIEENPERVVLRAPKCFGWELYNEYEVEPELRTCYSLEQLVWPVALKSINPKLTYTLTKSVAWGDPYCEAVIEFKEE
jgi:hypothetical protein